jgi:hypothetical protein
MNNIESIMMIINILGKIRVQKFLIGSSEALFCVRKIKMRRL